MSQLESRLAGLSPAQRRLLAEKLGKRSHSGITPRVSRLGPIRASFSQVRWWFLNQLEPENRSSVITQHLHFSAGEDAQMLTSAFRKIIERHTVLRTTFTFDGENLFQNILTDWDFQVREIDLRHLSEKDQSAEMEQIADRETGRPFDLSQDLPLRATWVRLDERRSSLLIVKHHIVSDHWSTQIMRDELDKILGGLEEQLPQLPIQYTDFSTWQHEQVETGQLDNSLEYWLKQLRAPIPVLALSDSINKDIPWHEGQRLNIPVGEELVEPLRLLARESETTLPVLLLAAFKVLLYRYTGIEDLAIGSPVAERTQPETENLIGCFLNTLVLRTDLSGSPGFRTYLDQVRDVFLDAYTHRSVPFELLVEKLAPERHLQTTPLFQVLYNFPIRSSRQETNTTLPFVKEVRKIQHAAFDLSLMAHTEQDGFNFIFEYRSCLFSSEQILKLSGHFITLLKSILAQPDQEIGALPILSEEETELVLQTWNETARIPAVRLAHQCFEAQAAKTPGAPAVEFKGNAWSYERIDREANRIAHFLLKCGAGPNVPVGLSLPRSIRLIVTLIAILKTGSCYVPLDPAYPAQRLAVMLRDSGVNLLITDRSDDEIFSGFDGQMLFVEELEEKSRNLPDDPIVDSPAMEDLAYILFTSGSTGRPKGVGMPHAVMANLISWQIETLPEPGRTLQFSPLSFDVSFQEIFSTLGNGGCLVLIDEETRRDPGAMLDLVRDLRVERIHLPFVALQQLALAAQTRALPKDLKVLVTAGEQIVASSDLRRFFERLGSCRLINQYGPTETHAATEYRLDADPWSWPDLPPIGKPISNARIYILDSHARPVPVGVTGELFIGGQILAQGYLGRPEETANKFLPDPFVFLPGARMYRTGDSGRFLPDGTIEFKGRADNQVKLRGYRVELGEIEAVLTAMPGVGEAVVVMQSDQGRDRFLAAYLIAANKQDIDLAALRIKLQAELPDYMVPAYFVLLDSYPMTPSGKIDRHALPAPEREIAGDAVQFVAPRTGLEQTITSAWEEALGVSPIGIDHNFFEIGGHSLSATRVFSALEKTLARKLPLALLFQYPTVRALAKAIDLDSTAAGWETLVKIQDGEGAVPFFCVHGFGGGVVGYAPLAAGLTTDQPFWGLQAAGLNGVDEPDSSIEEMAVRYIDAIRSVQPHGPYHLGGYCLGGTIAYEIARQLDEAGEKVEVLALFETNAPSRSRTRLPNWHPRTMYYFFSNLPYWFGNFMKLGGKQIWGRIKRNLRVRGRSVRGQYAKTGNVVLEDVVVDADQITGKNRALMESQIQASMRYAPGPYPGKVNLFRTKGRSFFRFYPPENNWLNIAQGGIEVHFIDGAHHNILEPEHVPSLARELSETLEESVKNVE